MDQAEMQKRIEDLEVQVQELLEWKEARQNQQITLPIDNVSKQIIKTTFGI